MRKLLIVVCSLACQSAFAGPLYHAKHKNVMSCADKKVAAEVHAISAHNPNAPGLYQIEEEGRCQPLPMSFTFHVVRFESFTVPAGVQHVALGVQEVVGYPPSYFYVMRSDIEKYHGKQHH